MVEKNRARLRQLDNPANFRALLTLPGRVLGERTDQTTPPRRVALRAMYAIAAELLIIAPIRADNLTGLQLDRHLVTIRTGGSRTRHLVIAAEEIKNGVPFEVELPADTERLLATYLARHHPHLSPGASPWLFPNDLGERRSTVSFSNGICDFVLRETGIRMNVHLFRHAAVKSYLDAHPEDIETARRLLGHKSITTTLRSYAETRTAAAFRRYDAVIQTLRAQPAAPNRRRTGGRRDRP